MGRSSVVRGPSAWGGSSGSGSGSGSLPTQMQVPSLWGWWSPRYANIIADAARLRVLPDLSGNDRQMTTSTTADEQPTYETSEINSLPIARFDAVKGAFSLGDAGTAAACRFFHGIEWTAVIVYKQTAAADGVIMDSNGGATTVNHGTQISFVNATNAIQVLICNSTAGTAVVNVTSSASSFPKNVAHILVVRYGYGRTGNDLTIEVDGVEVGAGDSALVPTWTNDPTGGGIAIGQRVGSGTSKIGGDFAEAMLYSRRITDAEVLSITGSLDTTFGL